LREGIDHRAQGSIAGAPRNAMEQHETERGTPRALLRGLVHPQPEVSMSTHRLLARAALFASFLCAGCSGSDSSSVEDPAASTNEALSNGWHQITNPSANFYVIGNLNWPEFRNVPGQALQAAEAGCWSYYDVQHATMTNGAPLVVLGASQVWQNRLYQHYECRNNEYVWSLVTDGFQNFGWIRTAWIS
jgi:hypothetical protein